MKRCDGFLGFLLIADKVDVFSYGLVLWEFWHRQLPFESLSLHDAVDQMASVTLFQLRSQFTSRRDVGPALIPAVLRDLQVLLSSVGVKSPRTALLLHKFLLNWNAYCSKYWMKKQA